MGEWFQDWFDGDYAVLYAHRDAEEAALAVQTALGAAPALRSGPVLDLACGSGRHLQALRRTNPAAFGLDLSPHLLALAPLELRGWLLRGDMRRLPLRPGSLSGICLWFTPFGYFEDAENRRLLADLAGLLRPGGALVLDVMNPARVRAELVAEDVVERAGLRVRSRRSIERGRVVKRMTLQRLDTGQVREAVESVRLYEPPELLAMAEAGGLRPLAQLGDYLGGPFEPERSPRWLGILERGDLR
jgi:SAM-dependent methyltransferase